MSAAGGGAVTLSEGDDDTAERPASAGTPATAEPADPPERPSPRSDRLRSVLLRRPTYVGLAVGLLFWWRSLYPTLMPRTWVTQAAMSAICLAVGIALGTLAGDVGDWSLRRAGRGISPSTRRRAWRVLGVVGATVVVLGVVMWPRWQGDQRELVTLDRGSAVQVVPMLLLSQPCSPSCWWSSADSWAAGCGGCTARSMSGSPAWWRHR